MFIIELDKLKSYCPNFPRDTLWLKGPSILFLLEEFQWNLAWSRAIVSTQSLRKFWYFLFQIPIQVIRGTTNLKKAQFRLLHNTEIKLILKNYLCTHVTENCIWKSTPYACSAMPYEAVERTDRLALDGNKQPVQYLRLPSLQDKKYEYLHVLHSRKYMGINYSYNYLKFIKIQYSFNRPFWDYTHSH